RARLTLDQPELGEQHAVAVLGPARERSWQEVAAIASLVSGLCWERLGQRSGAEQRLSQALEISERNALARVAMESHAALARVHKANGEKASSSRHASSARSIARTVAGSIDDEDLKRMFLRGTSVRAR